MDRHHLNVPVMINIENGARRAGGTLLAHVRAEPCPPHLYKLFKTKIIIILFLYSMIHHLSN